MTGLEAWAIISKNFKEIYRYRYANKRYFPNNSKLHSEEEDKALSICFMALKKFDEMEE